MNREFATNADASSRVPIRNLWHMLLYAWDELRHRGRWSLEAESAPTLDALLASVLCKLMQNRLRIGIGRGYLDHRETIRGIRGRIDFGASLRSVAFERGRATCRYQTFDVDVLKNQVIRSTLRYLLLFGRFGAEAQRTHELRYRIRALFRRMDCVSVIPLRAEVIRRLLLIRHDADYRILLLICHLVAEGRMPTESDGFASTIGVDRDVMRLHRIFEKFIANFYRIRLPDWAVIAQAHFEWPASEKSAYLPEMRPDLLFENKRSGQVIILDTKFTPNCLIAGPFGNRRFNPNHLYQIHAYLRSQENRSTEYRFASGILLYPAVENELSERVEVSGHCIRWETINLAMKWDTIEESLLALMAPD